VRPELDWLLVGLGNPGPEYQLSRHNIGFLVLDALAEVEGFRWSRSPLSETSEGTISGNRVLLLKPMTYMNLSGRAVAPVVRELGIALERVLVVHDDLDLPFGRLRFRKDGGDGGHKGVRSIVEAIGEDFLRLKVGIGRPQRKEEVIDYVLSPFSEEQMERLPQLLERTTEAILSLLEEGLQIAMNRFNASD